MADLCRACALRIQRSAISGVRRDLSRRSFSVSSTRPKSAGVPTFTETSSRELDETLLTLRDKYFVPAYLSKRQRNLIYKDKYKTELENTPAFATLGQEEIQLQHVNKLKEIPPRRQLVRKALDMLHEPADWRQLPSILEGLAKARSTPLLGIQEKIIRHAIQAGQFNIILQCLRKPELTGMTLKHDEILNLTLGGLHQTAQTNGWDQEHVGQALRFAGVLAELLEQDGHTRGKTPRSVVRNDPRTNPKVIGVFLEIAAVNAYKYHDGKDEDGSVMKYAARMMSCFENYEEPPEQKVELGGPQTEFNLKLPVYHGLELASKILGSEMPQFDAADLIRRNYEARLQRIIKLLKDNGEPKKDNSYAGQVMESWNACIRN